jgi:hypothetical protein
MGNEREKPGPWETDPPGSGLLQCARKPCKNIKNMMVLGGRGGCAFLHVRTCSCASSPCPDRALLQRLPKLLEHNRRVRELLPQVSSQAMWPRVLAECGRFPALMYRFVRDENLGLVLSAASANHVRPDAAAQAALEGQAAAGEMAHPAVAEMAARPGESKKRRHLLLSE